MVKFDIKGAFDNLAHALILKALRHHTDCKWILWYIERWLTAPLHYEDGRLEATAVKVIRTTVFLKKRRFSGKNILLRSHRVKFLTF